MEFNNSILIEKMRLEHIDRVLDIERLCFNNTWTRESFEMEITQNRCAYYVVARYSNKVVGYGGMWIIIDEAHVTNIAVHPEYRGMGVGNKIMEHLIDICVEKDLVGITLEVRKSNVIAKNLYKKYGFEEKGIRRSYYLDTNEDALIMWRYF
ncbi:MAG: ribosomal protein S18-alanine N-acetyltransferase [Clostridia bacterium]|nr:ribosomal protein S18-alanine N-acetyltransferase [Clostridia bacterium]